MKENMIFQKQRFNKSCIMKDILNNTTALTNLRRLNACRLYLCVTFSSEISNIKGSEIITGSLIYDKTNLAKSNPDWPNQNKPNQVTWSMWSRMTTKNILCTITIEHIEINQKTGTVDKEPPTINSVT